MIQKRSMKPFFKIFVSYVFITIVPSLIISFILTEQKMKEYEAEYQEKARWNASLYEKNIENFIGETVGRLDMLATLIKVEHNNLSHVEEVLTETHKQDKRFSGFYWANPAGELLISSNTLKSPVNVGDRPYFQQALELRKTSFSEAHIGRVTGRYIITIATPVIENNQILGVLLASLRLDELEKSIKPLLKDKMNFVVTDQAGKTVVREDLGLIAPKEAAVSADLEQLSWTITAKVSMEDKNIYWQSFYYYLAWVSIIANILLLLIYSARLKMKGKIAKEQYEFQKLELLGNLAASTAHEIRNPLTGIRGLVKLLSEEYKDEKAQSYFEVIQSEITRINAIVSELLVLGRPTAHSFETCNPKEILQEIEPILQSEANYMNVTLSISYSTDEVYISCVKDHIKQVILNLSKNSIQAMPDGGELVISLESSLDSCIITVKDTGVGISKDELNQIFDPFFTKKKDGSGIGLTICKRIIDSCEGDISVQSVPFKGTEVSIRIPFSHINGQ